MNQLERILHQSISVAWNLTYRNDNLMYQRLICQWNNAPTKQYGNKMKIMGVKEGVADWQWLRQDGQTTWIELKVEGGKQSEAQKDFETVCNHLGHRYVICRTLNEVWNELSLPLPVLDFSKSPFNALERNGLL